MLVSILSSINCYQGEKVEHGPKYSEPVWSKVQFEGDHEDITNMIYYHIVGGGQAQTHSLLPQEL